MIYLLIFSILLFLFIIIYVIYFDVKIIANKEYFLIKIYRFNFYKKYYKDIKDLNKEKNKISFIKVFKIIDIQSITIHLGGFNDYYYRAINYGLINLIFNLLGFIIKDQFIFNYYLDFNNEMNFNFECIIKSNLGKIIVGLLKRSK